MVCNALKLFMEVNPQLFEDCSHEYNQQQGALAEKQKARKQRWERLEQLAQTHKASDAADNSRRMEALRLGDDSNHVNRPSA
jgi:serine/threonine-protein phosphatase 2A regulatory subunit B'